MKRSIKEVKVIQQTDEHGRSREEEQHKEQDEVYADCFQPPMTGSHG